MKNINQSKAVIAIFIVAINSLLVYLPIFIDALNPGLHLKHFQTVFYLFCIGFITAVEILCVVTLINGLISDVTRKVKAEVKISLMKNGKID